MGMPLTTSCALQITKLSDFYPIKIDSGFLIWAEKGLTTVHELFDGEILKSFKQLQDQYGLCSKDFYQYLQIRDYIKSKGKWETLKQILTIIEAYLIKTIKEKSKVKVVSKMYTFLQAQLSDSSLDIKGKWELEATIIIKDDEWVKACENCHKTTNSPVWNEFGWKVIMRFFKTPCVIFNFDKSKSNLCWRNCNCVGDHSHIFWDCPILKPFWRGVVGTIRTMLNCSLPLELVHCIMGIPPREGLKKEHIKLIQLLLLVARKAITKLWLKAQPPTLEQWREGVKKVYDMEKITAQLHLNIEEFSDLWAPICNHFGWTR